MDKNGDRTGYRGWRDQLQEMNDRSLAVTGVGVALMALGSIGIIWWLSRDGDPPAFSYIISLSMVGVLVLVIRERMRRRARQ